MIKNTVLLHNGYVEIIVEKKNIYRHSVLIDIEDVNKITKIRISNKGYAYLCGGSENSKSLANYIMGHTPSREIVVDHINGNTLDNRKSNLRIVTRQENIQNRHSFSRNNTGVVGIQYRVNGKYEYYRVSITNPKTRKRFTKQFNINKLGKEKAFYSAKECLYNKKKEFGYLMS